MNIDDIDFDQLSRQDKMRGELLRSRDLEYTPDPTPVIGGVINENTLCWMYGAPGSKKSFIALDMASAVAVGDSWQGYRTTKHKVIYMAAEGMPGMKKRVRAWEKSYSRECDVLFLPRPVQILSEDFATLREICVEDGIGFIVFDTQARSTVGIDENSAQEMGTIIAHLDRLRRETSAAILLVHHSGWEDKHARGSTAILGAMDTVLKLTKVDEDNTIIECEKQKDGEPFDAMRLRVVPVDGTDSIIMAHAGFRPDTYEDVVRKTRDLRLAWWAYCEDKWVSASDLDTAGVVSRSTLTRHRFALIRHGLVAEQGTGNQTRLRLTHKPL